MLSATVIVPTYNRPDALARTLDALLAMEFPSELYDVVVIDTGRKELGAELVARSRGIRCERYPGLGVAAARNRGAALATRELLLFVDDDVVVNKANLRQHEDHHRPNEPCLVSGHWEFDPMVRMALQSTALGRYRLRYEDRYNKPSGTPDGASRGAVHPMMLAASNLSVPRDLFWSLDGFDERFPVAAEDWDLTWRARRAGYALIYDYDIRVIHNDQHRDLTALCRRLERAAVGTVYFTKKNTDAPRAAMIDLNGPIQRGDSARLVVRKFTRSLLSRSLPLWLASRLVSLAGNVMPKDGAALQWLYHALGGLYVFRGVRRGLALTSKASWPSAHQALASPLIDDPRSTAPR
jgi:GT2 family glycosyltransferase